VTTDADGYFSTKVELPNRQPVMEAQMIRTTVRRNVGLPHFSQVALSTWDKIIETVFLALLATTFGTMLAIPMSFLAARNLMSTIRTPLTSIALSILGWLAGFALSVPAARWINQVGESLQQNSNSLVTLGGVIAGPIVAWVLARWAMPQAETGRPSLLQRSGRILAILAAAISVILSLRLLSNLGITVGNSLIEHLGSFAFLGNFVAQLGDSLRMILPLAIALAAGGLLSSAGGGIGEFVSNRLAPGAAKGVNLIAAAIAGATLFASVGALVNWFYQIEDPLLVLWIPVGAGSILGAALALKASPKEALPIGTIAYTITRTLLNAIRSIEPLIMVIVFVVWVGIGPFAGLRAGREHPPGAPGGGSGDGSQSTADDCLCGDPTDRPAIHLVYHVPVGHQRADVHHHRFRRWRGHWLSAAAEHQLARLSRRQRPDVGYRRGGWLHGLYQL